MQFLKIIIAFCSYAKFVFYVVNETIGERQ